MRYICTSIVATLALVGTSLGETIHVPADYPTIQAAVDAASDGDEIVIAPGTYTGTGDAVADLQGKQLTLRASGAAESTLIDGEFSRRAVIAGMSSPNVGSTLQGLTLTKGYGSMGGGGLLLGGSSQITCVNCRFTGNTAKYYGGGIGSGSSYTSVSLVNCLFDGNSCIPNSPTGGATGGGIGGITNVDATNCTFAYNSAKFAGGADISSGTSIITNCVFEYNTSETHGGGITVQGPATITGCVFRSNSAVNNGGGAYCRTDNALFQNCHFESNSAYYGAGTSNHWDEPSYIECTFRSNNGTAAYNHGNASDFCSPSYEDCTIEDNNAGGWSGGGIYTLYGNPTVTNCLIRNNEGYGIRIINTGIAMISGSTICGNSSGQVMGSWDGDNNTITDVCDDDGDGISDDLDNCYLYNPDQADCNENGIGDVCDIADGVSDDTNENEIPDECECLADVVVDGEVNINDVLVTISSWGTSGPLGDVNYDGIVDIEDLLIVISAWGPCP